MPDSGQDNEAEVSDAMSENDNEYDDSNRDEDDKMVGIDGPSAHHTGDGPADVKKKYDTKTPLRPKRKKARRACYACQRAHLTCGDERPCGRCVKRGIHVQCQDGVRKKAKYLHDAPPEALRPVLGPNFNSDGPNAALVRPHPSRHPSNASDTMAASGGGSGFFSPTAPAPFPVYPQPNSAQTPIRMPDSMPSYSSQPSPVSPGFRGPPVCSRPPPPVGPGMMGPDAINFGLFDANNPALLNFDLEGVNFGSHYGALEWSILGHMSSGALEAVSSREASLSHTPGPDLAASYGSVFNGPGQFGQLYDGTGGMVDIMTMDQISGVYANGNLQHGLPHAYAIATGPANLASPPDTDHTASPQSAHHPPEDASPAIVSFHTATPTAAATTAAAAGAVAGVPPSHAADASRSNPKVPVITKSGTNPLAAKKKRDSSWIYTTITEPYSYLAGFHNLIAYLQKRFNSSQTVHIAKSLASIRPSFISCTKTLTGQDLVMMERVFQRTLMEYETFLDHNSSPAIVCRRTGEVVAVNNQFTALTGWTKDVLLGREPNLNVNTGSSDQSRAANAARDNLATPRLQAVLPADGRTQPVFVAELLDDDSVVQFYGDFSLLAFEDSRGYRQRKGRLLKYRVKESDGKTNETPPPPQPPQQQQHQEQQKDPRNNSILSNRVTRIDGELGISRIEKDGKMDCTYSWCIKRDPFDIPMMIVMNFLPCYNRPQGPRQLAV